MERTDQRTNETSVIKFRCYSSLPGLSRRRLQWRTSFLPSFLCYVPLWGTSSIFHLRGRRSPSMHREKERRVNRFHRINIYDFIFLRSGKLRPINISRKKKFSRGKRDVSNKDLRASNTRRKVFYRSRSRE